MIFSSEDVIAVESHDQGQKVLDIVIKALEIGIKDGTIRQDIDPSTTAVILWGQTSGLIQLISLKGDHLQNEHGFNKDQLISYAFELIRYSLEKVSL